MLAAFFYVHSTYVIVCTNKSIK